jgi:hypothetical protein
LVAGVDLEHPEAHPEPGKTGLRFLDHDFLRGRAGRPAAVRPGLQPEDGRHRGDVQPGPGAVQHPVEQVLHLPAGGEQQVALYSAW